MIHTFEGWTVWDSPTAAVAAEPGGWVLLESALLPEPTELTASEVDGHPLTTGGAYRAPDGRPISEDEANAISQAAYEDCSPDFPPDSVLAYSVSYGVAGSRCFEVLARESAVFMGATLVAGGLAAFVVSRRRPE